jgi:adenine-specific DNA-methyltransferase
MNLLLNSIFNGDCKELLARTPDASVDLIVSSPPYNIGKEYESRVALELYLNEQRSVLSECVRILKDTGSIFWQVGSYSHNGNIIPLDIRFFPILEDLGLNPKNRIMWVRQHGLHAKRKFSGRHESILWFTKTDNHKFNLDPIRVPQKWQNKKSYRGENKGELTCNPDGKNPGDVWLFQNVKHNHHEQTIHPCQFPEDMIARIVLSTTEPGDVIFDPYMGTGTVAVVARDLGRRYAGAELDPRYYEVAMRRVTGEPNANGSFANLKCLRAHVEKTGEPTSRFRFDVQIGSTATTGGNSKIFPEHYHLDEAERRISYEEDAFAAKLRGLPIPVDANLNGGGAPKLIKKKKPARGQAQLFDD